MPHRYARGIEGGYTGGEEGDVPVKLVCRVAADALQRLAVADRQLLLGLEHR